mgnify:CR=1
MSGRGPRTHTAPATDIAKKAITAEHTFQDHGTAPGRWSGMDCDADSKPTRNPLIAPAMALWRE